jgi:hypothetical protein
MESHEKNMKGEVEMGGGEDGSISVRFDLFVKTRLTSQVKL